MEHRKWKTYWQTATSKKEHIITKSYQLPNPVPWGVFFRLNVTML